MSEKTFLVEIGTEELPPKALRSLAESFAANVTAELDNAGPSLGSSDRGGHHAVRASAEYGVQHQVKRQIRERHQTASSRKFSGCSV